MKFMKYLIVISLAFSIVISISCKKKPAATDEMIQNIVASSTLDEEKYGIDNLTDKKLESWCEGKKDNGIGEYIDITFEKEVTVKNFYMKNGFGFSKYYLMNNRIKSLEISTGSDSLIVSLKDIPDVQMITLKEPLTGTIFKLTIKDVYKGTKYKDTCICELGFSEFVIKQPVFYGTAFWGSSVDKRCNCEAIVFKKDGSFECMPGPGTGDAIDVFFCTGSCSKTEGNKYECRVDNSPDEISFILKISGGYGYINGKRLESIDE